MGEPACGIPEERWVDGLSGRLSAEAYEAMMRHQAGCSACRRTYEEWRLLLEPAEEAGPSSAAEAGRRKLRRKVGRIGAKRKLGRLALNGGAIAAAAVLLLLGARALLFPGADQAADGFKPARAYAEKYEPSGAALMSAPDTVVYSLHGDERDAGAAARGYPSATVWVNGRTEELFVLLEGLLPSERMDVQAWGSIADVPTNLGVLEFHQGQGHLYSHVSRLPAFDAVGFTIEPKGGSAAPTAPASATVRLAAE